jgi:predicted ATPase
LSLGRGHGWSAAELCELNRTVKRQRTIRPGSLPIRRVQRDPAGELSDGEWPATIPAIAQLLREGLDLSPVTVLIGENGSGKSTIVEGIAQAYGLSPEGGSTGARHSSRPSESELDQNLLLSRGLGASRWGFFLRAETMHGFYSYLEANPVPEGAEPEPVFHEVSHGESFLALLRSRFRSPGLYLLDEPESALSFSACLGLVGLLHDLVEEGTSQVLLATHSPVVAAIPGARILQLDDEGFHERSWAELDLVQHYRSFLAEPMRYLRHVL